MLVVLVLLLLLGGAVAAASVFYIRATGASGPRKPLVVRVPPGATGADVGELLQDKRVIRSALAFRLLTRLRGLEEGFEAGKYRMKTNLSIDEALEILQDHPFVETVSVTVPEGYTIQKTAVRIGDVLGLDAKKFVALAKSGRWSLPPYLPKGTETLEGFLFPSTYDFLKDASARDVIRRLLKGFEEEARKLRWNGAKAFGVTPYEAVVVASLVEREARVPEDRGKVARVIYNRLKKGMPLQIDATIQYALGDPAAKLTYEHLKVQSPYNTYLNPGLPPTPIASPGLASLRAALEPTKGNWLYFVVVDKAGRHAFTDSYDEFLELKAGSSA